MELLPNARRMAIVYDAAFRLPGQKEELEAQARARNVDLSIHPARQPEDVGLALEACKAAGAEAVNFPASPLFRFLPRFSEREV